MRSLKSLFAMVTVCGAVVLLSGLSSAEMESGMGKAHHQAQVKLLQDSAAALQTSNPELAKKLSAWATDEMNEKEGKGHEERQARLKLLKDSAAALQASHPDLAASLTKKANKMEKVVKKDAREDSKERGEKKE